MRGTARTHPAHRAELTHSPQAGLPDREDGFWDSLGIVRAIYAVLVGLLSHTRQLPLYLLV